MKSYTPYQEFIAKRRLVRPHLAKYLPQVHGITIAESAEIHNPRLFT